MKILDLSAGKMTESQKAKAWRESLGLTQAELAGLTNYSKESIFLLERGQNSLGKPHNEHAWRRYKLACLAVSTMILCRIATVDQWNWSKGD